MGSRSDLESENENTTIDLKNDEFVQLLEENKSLFDKSQNPGVQKRKRQSIERIQKKYIEKTNKFVSTQQIRKRICNMKAEVRKNLRNGNPMKLKEWHKKVIQLMSEHDDLVADVTDEIPTSTANIFNDRIKIECNSISGESYQSSENFDAIPFIPSMDIPQIHQSDHIPTPFERLTHEPEETRSLSNIDLERALLLAKYELIVLQTQAAKEQLELITMQKKNVRSSHS